MSEPRLIEISINASAGGKVQIEDYGKITSDYGVNMSRRYAIPEDCDAEQAKEFQVEEEAELRAIVDALAQKEFDDRFAQSHLNPDREID